MLIELGVVEQRHKAVLEVLEGLPVTEVAARHGVTRQTVHRWLRWYASGGIAALADSSCRPASCPHQMPPAVEARIVALRTEHQLQLQLHSRRLGRGPSPVDHCRSKPRPMEERASTTTPVGGSARTSSSPGNPDR
jgi:transposase-like protein